MKDIVGLRDGLAKVFDDLKAEKIEPESAAQLTNCAGKIIGTLRVEMEYAEARGEEPNIKFMR